MFFNCAYGNRLVWHQMATGHVGKLRGEGQDASVSTLALPFTARHAAGSCARQERGEGAHSVAKTSACVGPAGCTKQLIPDQLLFGFILDHKLGVVSRVTCGLCHTHQLAATVRDGTSLRLLPRDP
jgi:hypothetical protein